MKEVNNKKEAIKMIKELEKVKYSMIQLINDSVLIIEKTLVED